MRKKKTQKKTTMFLNNAKQDAGRKLTMGPMHHDDLFACLREETDECIQSRSMRALDERFGSGVSRISFIDALTEVPTQPCTLVVPVSFLAWWPK
jgi:hypothetical protein